MRPEKTVTLSKQQIEDLARPFVGMVERIEAYFDDPKNERDYQEWYLQKYGHPAPIQKGAES